MKSLTSNPILLLALTFSTLFCVLYQNYKFQRYVHPKHCIFFSESCLNELLGKQIENLVKLIAMMYKWANKALSPLSFLNEKIKFDQRLKKVIQKTGATINWLKILSLCYKFYFSLNFLFQFCVWCCSQMSIKYWKMNINCACEYFPNWKIRVCSFPFLIRNHLSLQNDFDTLGFFSKTFCLQ